MRLSAAVLSACLVCAGAAHADAFFPGLYTDINYSGAYPDFKAIPHYSTPSYLDGLEGDIGWRFNRFYSIEASYSYFTGSTGSNNATLSTTLQTGAIDGLGYLPFGRQSPWALYADIGATGYFLNASTTGGSAQHEASFGARAGGGIQYQFSEDLGLRLGARYEWAHLPDLSSAEVFSLGLVWQR